MGMLLSIDFTKDQTWLNLEPSSAYQRHHAEGGLALGSSVLEADWTDFERHRRSVSKICARICISCIYQIYSFVKSLDERSDILDI
jgi:hypothetical protein